MGIYTVMISGAAGDVLAGSVFRKTWKSALHLTRHANSEWQYRKVFTSTLYLMIYLHTLFIWNSGYIKERFFITLAGGTNVPFPGRFELKIRFAESSPEM